MTKSVRLNDLQLVLLSNAAARDNGSLLPLPESCTTDSTRIGKAATSLLRRKLIKEIPVADRSLAWRELGQDVIGLFITDAGLVAIGADDDQQTQEGPAVASKALNGAGEDGSAATATTPRPGSKIATVVALLQRPEGATLDAMVEATGWLPHTTRAALTGLRKKGHTLASAKVDGVRYYRIAMEA